MTEQEIDDIRFFNECINSMIPECNIGVYAIHRNTCKNAIKALEKQTPKKLVLTRVRKKCSSCNHIITDKDCTKLKIKYCYNCGQAIDWGGTDD